VAATPQDTTDVPVLKLRDAAPAPSAPPPSASRALLSPEERLSGDMLMLTTGFMMCAAALWLAIYWSMGYQYSTSIPLVFQGLSALTIALYWKFKRLYTFAVIQLALILFTPFVMQWSIGNFVNASGVSLWGLLAPVGAVTVLGARQSMPWFFAWLFMTVLAGVFDYLLPHSAQRVDLSTVAVFFVLNFAAISVMIYSLLWYFAAEKQKLRELVDASFEEIRHEKERSEKLLLNILPPAIAERLKRNEVNIAQAHADVTVMVADIVGFTRMSEEMSPPETVAVLNDVFSIFDELADLHRVEKIKTIGDAYMVASGVPTPRPDHAQALANLALDMVDSLRPTGDCGDLRLELRVGINSGPVVAGVIGRKRFLYDLWGDAVNTASRMESQGTPGRIQITGATYELLKDEFECERRGTVEIKGRGQMETWYLLGRRSERAPMPEPSPLGASVPG
jgi:adenylate cyclase